MGVKDNGVKHELFDSIPLHVQGLNCGEGVYELEDHVGEEALSSNLPLELRPIKIIPLVDFLNRLLKNT